MQTSFRPHNANSSSHCRQHQGRSRSISNSLHDIVSDQTLDVCRRCMMRCMQTSSIPLSRILSTMFTLKNVHADNRLESQGLEQLQLALHCMALPMCCKLAGKECTMGCVQTSSTPLSTKRSVMPLWTSSRLQSPGLAAASLVLQVSMCCKFAGKGCTMERV